MASDSKPVVVIKVGTSSLIDVETRSVRVSAMARVAEAAVQLQAGGYHVILVSSGAVGLGCARLGLAEKPKDMAGKQAAAAVGQVRLMSLYDDIFSALGARCAQVLLTYDCFGERTQYLNARNTFLELLRLGVVPVVNENDTIAVQELRVGDNDTLSALVAAMVAARWLFLFTDVDSLFDANPRDVPDAAPIAAVPATAIIDLRRQMGAGAAKLVVNRNATGTATAAVAAPVVTIATAVAVGGDAGTPTAAAGSVVPAANGAVHDAVAIVPRASPTSAAGYAASRSSGSSSSALPAPQQQQGKAGSQFGTGGMLTKLKAAQLATAAGVAVVVTNSTKVEGAVACLLRQLADTAGSLAAARAMSRREAGTVAASSSGRGDSSGGRDREPVVSSPTRRGGRVESLSEAPGPVPACSAPASTPSASSTATLFIEAGMGTTFLPSARPVTGRKRWILGLTPAGSLVIDAGAVQAVVQARKSLFPAGILRVSGDFDSHDAVSVVDESGAEVARALVNYCASDVRRACGRRSKDLAEALGFPGPESVADRDNIVLVVAL